MESHEEASDLLDQTMDTLKPGVMDMTPQNGKGVLDQWINTLGDAENTRELTNLLQQLKTQLEAGDPNPGEMQQILTDLSTNTHEMSVSVGPEGDMATRLEALASTLQATAGQLK
ncbi:hypothetical protein [Fibrella aquatilis]|uniref:Uncharacterized protein n=1 Tax=Fibrella aquatilis TaxID=2817059 RepID=A0A939K062_9BACT|nr:hypothetical protein [Fibrella aquatilis]MBO0930910.1 hypothetical protein [Fibrella aquatilis]